MYINNIWSSVNASSFQIGLKFDYWDKTDSKYKTFKEEIHEYKYISFKAIKNVLMPKVNQYFNTKRAKQTKMRAAANRIDIGSNWGMKNWVEQRYGMEMGAAIKFHHLLALCLYTDFDSLSTDFSKSFRPLNNYESEESVKDRNRNYWFMSKYLSECVQLFGDYKSAYSNNKLMGPFYSGLSFIATFPFVDISLNSPTSTSTETMVALRFSGNGEGIMVEFDNHDMKLRAFNCSWLSQ